LVVNNTQSLPPCLVSTAVRLANKIDSERHLRGRSRWPVGEQGNSSNSPKHNR
jgi:hypothetical protein